MASACVTLIEGPLGSGKTNTVAAFAVDDYLASGGKDKIFSNFRFYGIKYVFCDTFMMLEYLNTNLISKAKLIVDEAYITGDARQGMNPLAKLFTWLGMQARKREIELFVIVQHGRFIDWRFKFIMKRRILCKYNEDTRMIKLTIKDVHKRTEKRLSYWAPQYWKYFDTNELPIIPEKAIARATEWA